MSVISAPAYVGGSFLLFAFHEHQFVFAFFGFEGCGVGAAGSPKSEAEVGQCLFDDCQDAKPPAASRAQSPRLPEPREMSGFR